MCCGLISPEKVQPDLWFLVPKGIKRESARGGDVGWTSSRLVFLLCPSPSAFLFPPPDDLLAFSKYRNKIIV